MKYVQRRANRFEFRFPLPDDLAGKAVPVPWPQSLASLLNQKTGRLKTEIIRSLQTAEAKAAERRALAHIEEAHRLVDQARRVMKEGPPEGLTPEQIESLVREHEVELLERDEKLRRTGIGLDLQQATIEPDGLGMTDDDLEFYRFVVRLLDQSVRRQAAKMRPGEVVAFAVNHAVDRHGIVLHPEDPAWRELELGFLRAERQAFDWIKARLEGEKVPGPDRPVRSPHPVRSPSLPPIGAGRRVGAGAPASRGTGQSPKRAARCSGSLSCMGTCPSRRSPRRTDGHTATLSLVCRRPYQTVCVR
ncbi:MAG: DUF6538 domain-containing protein [Microvirga sp.]